MTQYEKLNFVNGSPPALNAATLNHMEDGIAAATEGVTALNETVKNNKTETDKAFATKADKATTLAGYGIKDVYTKDEVDEKAENIGTAIYAKTLSTTISVSAGNAKGIHVVNDGKWLKNSIVKLSITADDTVVNGKVAFGVVYADGTQSYIVEPNVNEQACYITTDDTNDFIGYIAANNVIGNGNVTMTVEYVGVLEQIVNLHNDLESLKKHPQYEGKSFSIIGDSYSAYQGWIPDGYVSLYGNPDKTSCKSVTTVKQMWWHLLSKQLHMSLINNGSWEGTTICNTGYYGADYTSKSFVTRAKSICGEDNVTSIKPDVIFIFGGTNDDWANAPIGSVKYADWTTDDLKSVLPAFCYLIDYIKLYNPQATIINIVNEGMDTEIATGMSTACEHYNVINIELTGINKESNHPTATGQAAIAEEIIAVLKLM